LKKHKKSFDVEDALEAEREYQFLQSALNKKWTKEYILQQTDDQDEGYILEVDLEIPQDKHNFFNDYPLAPQSCLFGNAKKKKKDDAEGDDDEASTPRFEASPHMNHIKAILNQSNVSTKKLAPNLENKVKYVCHYRNLKLYLRQGCVLTNVHRVLKFKQAPILKEYIIFNMEKRKQAKKDKNDFLTELFKLMNNAIFGRTMMNKDKQRVVKLFTDDKKLLNTAAKPYFQDVKTFQNDLCAVELKKLTVKYDSPIVMGMSILELSKVLMYNFHYNVIKNKYGDKARLLFTDTDSLCYHIETGDVYQDMIDMDGEKQEFFDGSEYPKDFKTLTGNIVWSDTNEKQNGFFKDETKGIIISDFIG
jgi:hypothetical protein